MTLKSVNDQPITDLDIFEVHQYIIKACGCKPKIMPQRDGSLLVKVTSQEEAYHLSALSDCASTSPKGWFSAETPPILGKQASPGNGQ